MRIATLLRPSFLCILVLLLSIGTASAAELPAGFGLEPVVGGLTEPSSLDYTPDGRILITERTTGNLRVVHYGELAATAICSVSVTSTGEGGLLGVAVHPQFDSNSWIYLYYTDQASGKNKVTRFVLGPTSCSDATDMLADLGAGANFLRNGGGIGFGPDEKLYVATGDCEDDGNGQSLSALEGKVLRLNDDGSIPADNPSAGSYVYASGVRDGRGLSFSTDGQVYASDRGSVSVHDEMNAPTAGGNLGWAIEDGAGGSLDEPLVDWLPTVGVHDLALYTADVFPDLDADGIDNDHDHLGPDRQPGIARLDDNAKGTCIGSNNNAQPCSDNSECFPGRPGENTFYCEFRDDIAEICPAGSPLGDDDCDNLGSAGIDEPDESFLHNLFGTSTNTIERAVLGGAGLDQVMSSEVFLDSTALPDCPTGWTGLMGGRDGHLYALATNSGGSTGALYRVIYDAEVEAREVSAPDSYIPLMVGKTAFGAARVKISWEDLRDDAKQPRRNAAVPALPVREYTLWKGTIGDYYSHTPVPAFDATEGAAVNDVVRSALILVTAEDNDYFLVSARHNNLEGPLGSAALGDRPGYATTEICDTIGYHWPGYVNWNCGNDFTLLDEHGETHSLYEYRGQPIAMDFSAVWCPPCVSQANVMENIQQDYKDRGVKLLTVLMDEDSQSLNFDGRPTLAECRNWADRPGANPDHTFACFADPNPAATRVAWPRYNKFGALPTNVILDSGLQVAYTSSGFNETLIRLRLDQLVGTTDSCLH